MNRKHEIFVTNRGRIVYRISDLHTGQQISVRDRSAGEAPITFVDLILEVTHDLDGFVVRPVRLWDESDDSDFRLEVSPASKQLLAQLFAPETRQDFEGHLTPMPDDDFETIGRCM